MTYPFLAANLPYIKASRSRSLVLGLPIVIGCTNNTPQQSQSCPLHLRLRLEIATFQAAAGSFIRLVALPIAACANISLPQIPADSTRYNFYTMEQFTCQFTTAQMPDQKRTARLFEEILQCGGICKLARVRNRFYSCSTTLRRPL